jgi:rubrerythrin
MRKPIAARDSVDARIRALASELAAEERQHVQWTAQALEYHTTRPVNWEAALQ